MPEIDLSTRDTRGGRLSDRYEAGVRPLPLEVAYDTANGCQPKQGNEPGFSRSANRSYRHISDGYGSWKASDPPLGSLAASRGWRRSVKLFTSRRARALVHRRATKGLRARPSCLVHRRAHKRAAPRAPLVRTPPGHKRTQQCRAAARRRRAAPRRRRAGGARPARPTRARAAAAPPRAPRRGPWPSSPRRRRFQCRLDQL